MKMIKTGNSILIISLMIIFLLIVCDEEIVNFTINRRVSNKNIQSDQTDYSFKPVKGMNTFSTVAYYYDSLKKKLILRHKNVVFSSCYDDIVCEIIEANDTITIIEKENNPSGSIKELYNLDIELDGIEAQSHVLNFIEPYADDQTKLCFTANFSDSAKGIFTVNRNLSAWLN
jgi:hypothetical protein